MSTGSRDEVFTVTEIARAAGVPTEAVLSLTERGELHFLAGTRYISVPNAPANGPPAPRGGPCPARAAGAGAVHADRQRAATDTQAGGRVVGRACDCGVARDLAVDGTHANGSGRRRASRGIPSGVSYESGARRRRRRRRSSTAEARTENRAPWRIAPEDFGTAGQRETGGSGSRGSAEADACGARDSAGARACAGTSRCQSNRRASGNSCDQRSGSHRRHRAWGRWPGQ
jgi:hypothetical protein